MSDPTDAKIGKRPTEAFCGRRLFEDGMGYVTVARFKAGGTVAECGAFLVDAWCLGIKNAFLSREPILRYEREFLESISERYPFDPMEPACARKLIEKAVEYAASLGFAPHSNYKAAARVFGGIDPAACSRTFQFGRGGKPFYMRGPGETEAQAQRIIEHLRRRCGEGNFDFVVMQGPTEELNRFFQEDENS